MKTLNILGHMKLAGQGQQDGYAMAALLVAMAIMAVMTSVAMPVWSRVAQREKEEELVFRGEQYARAIGLFQRLLNRTFHMGDLVNIEVKDGEGAMITTTNRITLSPGRLSLFDADGSSFIIHTNEDTYCDQESDLRKGCAGGSRDACGIIKAD